MISSPPSGSPRLLLRGFSLVEVVLALGIASFSLVVMLGVFGSVVKVRGDNVNRTEAYRAVYALQGQMNEPGAFAKVYGWVQPGMKELVFVRYKANAAGLPNAAGERYRSEWVTPDLLTPAMESAMEGRWIKARLNWDDRDHVNSMARSELPTSVDQYTDAQATLEVKLYPVPSPSFPISTDTTPTLTTSLTLTR